MARRCPVFEEALGGARACWRRHFIISIGDERAGAPCTAVGEREGRENNPVFLFSSAIPQPPRTQEGKLLKALRILGHFARKKKSLNFFSVCLFLLFAVATFFFDKFGC